MCDSCGGVPVLQFLRFPKDRNFQKQHFCMKLQRLFYDQIVLGVMFLLAGFFNCFAQEYPFAPGELNRILVVVETVGSSFGTTKTTNILAPNATFEIKDSTFP